MPNKKKFPELSSIMTRINKMNSINVIEYTGTLFSFNYLPTKWCLN